ncbi:hypothetical protein [Streptomyces tanashiensis]
MPGVARTNQRTAKRRAGDDQRDHNDQQAEQSFGDRADDAQHDRGDDDRAPSVPFGTVNSGRHGYRRITERSREEGRFRRSETL